MSGLEIYLWGTIVGGVLGLAVAVFFMVLAQTWGDGSLRLGGWLAAAFVVILGAAMSWATIPVFVLIWMIIRKDPDTNYGGGV